MTVDQLIKQLQDHKNSTKEGEQHEVYLDASLDISCSNYSTFIHKIATSSILKMHYRRLTISGYDEKQWRPILIANSRPILTVKFDIEC